MSGGMMSDGTMPGGSAGDALSTIVSVGQVPQQVSRAPQGIKQVTGQPDAQALDPSYVAQAVLVQFIYKPELLPLGNINAKPGVYYFSGLVNRTIVKQSQVGWKPAQLTATPGAGWNTQPADAFSGKVPQGLPQQGGPPSVTVSIDQAV